MTNPANNNPNSVSKISYTDLIHEAVGKTAQEELSLSEWVQGATSVYLNDTLQGMALSLLARGIGSPMGCSENTLSDKSKYTCYYIDNDGDGYGDETADSECARLNEGESIPDGYSASNDDCNDDEANINPAENEICDGIDNNCRDGIDENTATDAPTWYQDNDDDNYGSASSPQVACTQPTGYVDNSDDCDDALADINPDATEVCNDKDDNCNGTVDEELTSTYYRDSDGDGYGDASTTTAACSATADYVADNTDCDDTDASVNPFATEILNGVDENCDVIIDNIPLADADTKFIGEAANDGSGISVAGAGDVDSNGFADLLIGAIGESSGGTSAGAAYLFYGPVATGSIDLSTYDAKFTGEAASDYAGFVAGAGDVNNDGNDDMLIGASDDSTGTGAGAAYLVYGPATGDIDLSASDAKFVGETAYDYAYSIAGAGDVNGDTFDDILVGALRNDAGGTDAGAAYLVYGPNPESISLSSASVTKFIGEEANDLAGLSIAGAGDVDGDGLDDLLIGAYQNDAGGIDANVGAAYLIYGGDESDPLSGSIDLSTADTKFIGEAVLDYAGYSVAGAGDVDDDGKDDLLVGALLNDKGDTDAGAAYLIYGGDGSDLLDDNIDLSTADAKLIGETAGDYAGFSVAGAGNVNGDSFADMLIGAYQNDSGGTNAGGAYLVYGGSAVTGNINLSDFGAKFTGEAAGDYAGYSVAGAGDVDGDTLDDLLFGAPYNDAGGTDAGAAYLSFSRW